MIRTCWTRKKIKPSRGRSTMTFRRAFGSGLTKSLCGAFMLSFLHKYARNLFYSQNGEEGVIIQCVRRFADNGVLRSDSDGHCVEIGGHDGKFCSNTALLIDSYWSGLFVDADYGRYLQCKANWGDRSEEHTSELQSHS